MRISLIGVFVYVIALASASVIAEDSLSFERDIRPILKTHCFHCHGESEEVAGRLDVRLRRFLVKGGESGAAIVPGDAANSLLIARVSEGEMPPGEPEKRPSAGDIAKLQRWIEQGAKTLRAEPETLDPGAHITVEERAHWSFQPIRRPAVPQLAGHPYSRNAIDAFLLRRLQTSDLDFSPSASRRTLIRRLTLDLHGLPPTPEAVQAFVDDTDPGAYTRLVERLLSSPHYGERWGRHWLDVAGYADSEGVTNDDRLRPYAFKFRDYVIRAFNADKPFDQFLVEQLAGDELVGRALTELTSPQVEQLVATGFLRMAPDGTAATNDALRRNQMIAATMDVVGSGVLGLTVACAQCHDHRYDPIPQKDYYRLRAIFEPSLDWKNWQTPQQRLVSLYTDDDRKAAAVVEEQAKAIEKERAQKQAGYIAATFEKELAKLPKDIRPAARAARETAEKKRTAEQVALLRKYPGLNVTAGSLYLYDKKAADDLKSYSERAKTVRGQKPVEEFVRALTEPNGQRPDSYVFTRGDHEQPAQQVSAGELTVLGHDVPQIAVEDASRPTSGRRLAYAQWLTSGRHPLTARVLVNRVWRHHFGQGLVNTPGDFGVLGERPTHPELLDWLAAELMSAGWRLKTIHRLIVTSHAYRQSRPSSRSRQVDPDNRLYAGRVVRRLEAEVLRDAILTVSGKLNDRPYGPAVPVMADRTGQWVIGIENLNAGRPGPVLPMHGEEFRRSVYVQVRRTRPLAIFDTFDWPRMTPNCHKRAASTGAPQSLLLMNNDFVLDHAKHFADRVATWSKKTNERIDRAWELAWGRPPSDREREQAAVFLADQAGHLGNQPDAAKGKSFDADHAALVTMCHMLLIANEFLYTD